METVAGFLLGFFGSAHCAAMCGPIALALPGGSLRGIGFVAGRLLYSCGRIVTYALLGGIVGIVGHQVALAGLQHVLSVAIGVLMMIMLVLPSRVSGMLTHGAVFPRLYARLKMILASLFQRRSLSALFALGLVNGLLPCGFVYVALAGGAATGSETGGMLFMTGFGAGTVPTMLGIALLGPSLSLAIRRKVSAMVPVLTFIVAVLLVLRGLDLGIPYISPVLSGGTETVPAKACH
jgi:hypothetical protein